MTVNEIALTAEQHAAANALKEGGVLFAYRDDSVIRIETVRSQDPYVWRGGQWRPMR